MLSGPLQVLELLYPPVDGDWLANDREWLLVLDIREEADTFSQGHISSALLADVNRIRFERDCSSVSRG